VLHAARWNTGRKSRKKSRSAHHCTTLSVYIFATKAPIDNRKKLVKQQYVLQMSPQYGELRPTSGWDRFVTLGHPTTFQLVSRLGSVTARHVLVGVSQTAPLNRGRHLCSAGRPSRWALAHNSSCKRYRLHHKVLMKTTAWSEKIFKCGLLSVCLLSIYRDRLWVKLSTVESSCSVSTAHRGHLQNIIIMNTI